MPIRRYRREQPPADEPEVARKSPVISLAVVVVLLALLGILYFWSQPLPPDGMPSQSGAGMPSKAMQLALPQAPGLSSASRAFSPSSALVPLSARSAGAFGVAHVNDSPPEETLLKVGRHLSPEWGLAVTLLMTDSASVAAPDVVSTLSAATPVPTETRPAPAADAASAGSVPQLAESLSQSVPVLQVPTREAPQFLREAVHPGITRRIYAAPTERVPQSLAAQVAECSKQGAIAGETCRQRICRAHWGKDAACPINDAYVLP